MSHIGFLVPTPDGCHAVVGRCCGTHADGVRIYRVNIEPYGQSCARCGALLVAPRSPGWPELYDGQLAVARRAS